MGPAARDAGRSGPRIGELEAEWSGGARPAVVDLLARAFRDAPLNAAVIGGGPRRRLRVNRHGLRASLAAARTGGGWTIAAGDRVPAAALIAVPPSRFPLPPPPLGLQLRCLVGQGPRTVRRWGAVYRRLLEVHPVEPHWYLSVLGVEPAHQRRGLGAALLSAFARRVDADGAPAYLESDRIENLPFYERAGFRSLREIRVAGVPVWCMWRDAK